MSKANRLRKVKITELSLVDRPANPGAEVRLVKRDDERRALLVELVKRVYARDARGRFSGSGNKEMAAVGIARLPSQYPGGQKPADMTRDFGGPGGQAAGRAYNLVQWARGVSSDARAGKATARQAEKARSIAREAVAAFRRSDYKGLEVLASRHLQGDVVGAQNRRAKDTYEQSMRTAEKARIRTAAKLEQLPSGRVRSEVREMADRFKRNGMKGPGHSGRARELVNRYFRKTNLSRKQQADVMDYLDAHSAPHTS